jgi:hypothetical protein
MAKNQKTLRILQQFQVLRVHAQPLNRGINAPIVAIAGTSQSKMSLTPYTKTMIYATLALILRILTRKK